MELTVKELKDKLSKLGEEFDELPVLVQRVEDIYYEKHGRKTIKLPEWGYFNEPEYDSEYHPATQCALWSDRDKNLHFIIDLHY